MNNKHKLILTLSGKATRLAPLNSFMPKALGLVQRDDGTFTSNLENTILTYLECMLDHYKDPYISIEIILVVGGFRQAIADGVASIDKVIRNQYGYRDKNIKITTIYNDEYDSTNNPYTVKLALDYVMRHIKSVDSVIISDADVIHSRGSFSSLIRSNELYTLLGTRVDNWKLNNPNTKSTTEYFLSVNATGYLQHTDIRGIDTAERNDLYSTGVAKFHTKEAIESYYEWLVKDENLSGQYWDNFFYSDTSKVHPLVVFTSGVYEYDNMLEYNLYLSSDSRENNLKYYARNINKLPNVSKVNYKSLVPIDKDRKFYLYYEEYIDRYVVLYQIDTPVAYTDTEDDPTIIVKDDLVFVEVYSTDRSYLRNSYVISNPKE